MEEKEYEEIKDYLVTNVCPAAYNEIQKHVLRKRAQKYEVKEEVLYRVLKGRSLRVITSFTERFDLIRQAHLGSGRHKSQNETVQHIYKESACYWKTVVCDVQKYLVICETCNDSLKRDQHMDASFERSMIWRQVVGEILGPFLKTDDDCEYVAVMVDPASRWVEGGVLKSLCPKELAAFLLKTFTSIGFCHSSFVGLELEFAEQTNELLMGLCSGLSTTSQELKDFIRASTASKCKSVGEMPHVSASKSSVGDSTCSPTIVALPSSQSVVPFVKHFSFRIEQREQDLSVAFGPKFPYLLQYYTKCINSLVDSNPLTWDKELSKTLFQLRTETPEGYDSSAFHVMFQREPFLIEFTKKPADACDNDRDSDTLLVDDSDDSDCNGVLTATTTEVAAPKEMKTNTCNASKRSKVTAKCLNRRTSQTHQNNTEYTPPRSTNAEIINNNSNGTTNVTSRYGLRTTLKAKGDSSMVERFLRLSSAKRSLPSTDCPVFKANTTSKRRRKSILSPVTSPTADEATGLNIKNEHGDVHNEKYSSVMDDVIATLEVAESVTKNTDPVSDAGASPSDTFSPEESMVTEAIVIKVAEQVSLLKSNQPAAQENKTPDVIELPPEALQVIPKEVHVTIVADNNDVPSASEAEHIDANIKSEPLSEEEEADDVLFDHTNLAAKKRKRRNGKSRKMAKELPHKCPKCVATYLATPEELQLHLECHVPNEKFLRCPHCPKTVRNWSHLQRHLISHDELAPFVRNIPEDKRKCTFCGKIFSTREGMLRHEQIIHKEVHRFECLVCGRKYKERKTFKRHMDLHANVVYRCEQCKYKTKIRRNLIDHSRIHEGRGFQCEVCSKIFTKQSILLGHMEIHNTNRSTLICEQCGMKLANAASLRQHVRNIHEKPGRFPCEHCNYIGKTKGNLMSHMDRAHNKPFKCPHCTYSCKSDSALKRHTDIFHNVLERRFACSACPYRARDPKQLSEHMRFRHNPNALRFPCQFCNMKFKTMTTLRHHLPAHTGQHLYSCQLCGYSAKYRQTVHHHVKVKHPGQRVSNIVKGTPCSEIPCSILTDVQLNQAIARVANQECTVYMPEGVVLAEHEPGLFVAKILESVKGETEENVLTETTDVSIITEDEALAIPTNSTIELQFITEEENGKNVAMKIVPTQEQTEKAVELLLLAMDPHQTVTEVVSEETVQTTE